ncbi:MAG TPA: phosphodiester glycosidase family protein [Chroococcales cyanobacterium]
MNLGTVSGNLFRSIKRSQIKFAGLLLASLSILPMAVEPAGAIGMIVPRPITGVGVRVHPARLRYSGTTTRLVRRKSTVDTAGSGRQKRARPSKAAQAKAKKTVAKVSKAIPPQQFIDRLQSETIAPGVIYRHCRGSLSINVLDIDMVNAPVKVKPNMAGETFDRLKDVADHARESKAIAAINANYFKKDGTPLGTLIVDREWVAGPLYDRVSMGITDAGYVRIDRVKLGGLLTSNNPDVPTIWVNNVNQPRRTGARLVAYTQRWGKFVKLAYAGCLVAVDAQGRVMDKGTTTMGIPWGGYVLTDSKTSPISKLERGDIVQIEWKTAPNDWDDVVQAVSGGPMLIKDGRIFLDLKDENFRRGWTGAQIHARTAAGITAQNHLLLVTVEGPHTLWDLAKFLHALGATDAMNLDGGGSTTMVVNGRTVTRNASAAQRRVASSIIVLDASKSEIVEHSVNSAFQNGQPQKNLSRAGLSAESAAGSQSADGSRLQSEAILASPVAASTSLEDQGADAQNADSKLDVLPPVPAYHPDVPLPKKHRRWWHIVPDGLLH